VIAPPDIGQKPDAHLVGAVEVLEDEQRRTPLADDRQQSAHRLEQPEVLLASGLVRGDSVAELGEQADQLAPPDLGQGVEDARRIEQAAPADGVDPGSEGQQLLALERAPEQDVAPALERLRGELG